MSIIELKPLPPAADEKLQRMHAQFSDLLAALRVRELPEANVAAINEAVTQVNESGLSGAPLLRLIRKQQAAIVRRLEKELKIVPQNYYRNMWMAVGMTSFGLPFGLLIGKLLGQTAYFGIGLPFGMLIGLAVGASLDRKALREGRQLDLQVRY